MPKIGMREEFDLPTRDRFTTVQCELGIRIEGKELPNLDVVGGAMEKALEVVRMHIAESYLKVPERTTV